MRNIWIFFNSIYILFFLSWAIKLIILHNILKTTWSITFWSALMLRVGCLLWIFRNYLEIILYSAYACFKIYNIFINIYLIGASALLPVKYSRTEFWCPFLAFSPETGYQKLSEDSIAKWNNGSYFNGGLYAPVHLKTLKEKNN